MVTLKKSCLAWCGVALLVVSGGCAAAYHDYPCGCVPYGYFPPPPLAYTAYDACPTPVGRCYLEDELPARAPSPRPADEQ